MCVPEMARADAELCAECSIERGNVVESALQGDVEHLRASGQQTSCAFAQARPSAY